MIKKLLRAYIPDDGKSVFRLRKGAARTADAVVQTNSPTAEETAAFSGELSGRANTLQEPAETFPI